MGRYVLRRSGSLLLTIVVVVILNFIIMHAAPGDPTVILTGLDRPSPEVIQALQERYGLDQPLYIQLEKYLVGIAHGDFGQSIIYDQPVFDLVSERLPATLLLTFTAAILALIIGSALGIFSARRYFSKTDLALSFGSYTFYSMPSFWLGLMLILLFSSWLKLFPTSGMTDPRHAYTGLRHILDVGYHLVLPVMALALVQIPVYYRIARSSMVQVLREDFITTLRATGMRETKIFRKYAFKNAILPTVTMFGLQLAYVVTGAALVEIVFSWPGMGRFMLTAVFRRDYPLLMGIYLMMALSVAVTILITDVLYAVLDPRIRLK